MKLWQVGVLGLLLAACAPRPQPREAAGPAAARPAAGPAEPAAPAEPAPSEMPGIAELSKPEVDLFWRMALGLPSPCGQARSLWESRLDARCGARARRALRYVRDLVQEGDLALDIREKYPRRYQCPRVALNLGAVPSRGQAVPTVTLVEFSDFQCPRCREAESEVRRLLEQFERLKLVFVHYPLTLKHPYAELAARASVAAGQQGRFWAYHDLLYGLERPMSEAAILDLAKQLSLDMKQFAADMEKAHGEVTRQRQIGDRLKLQGTPTFYMNGCLFPESDVRKLEGWILDEVDLVGR